MWRRCCPRSAPQCAWVLLKPRGNGTCLSCAAFSLSLSALLGPLRLFCFKPSRLLRLALGMQSPQGGSNSLHAFFSTACWLLYTQDCSSFTTPSLSPHESHAPGPAPARPSLAPFLPFRRYRSVLTKDTNSSKLLSMAQLMSVVMQLRKIINHPKQLLHVSRQGPSGKYVHARLRANV